MTNNELDNYLPHFYAEARKKDGALYSRSSLLGICNAIERYLNNPPLNRGISITKGVKFQASNKLLQSQIKLNIDIFPNGAALLSRNHSPDSQNVKHM